MPLYKDSISFALAARLPPTLRSFFTAPCWTRTIDPKGPTGFSHLIAQTFVEAPTVPVQAVPAGMLATRGKFALAAVLLPFVPATLVVTVIGVKVFPVASADTEHAMGPAPSALI